MSKKDIGNKIVFKIMKSSLIRQYINNVSKLFKCINDVEDKDNLSHEEFKSIDRILSENFDLLADISNTSAREGYTYGFIEGVFTTIVTILTIVLLVNGFLF